MFDFKVKIFSLYAGIHDEPSNKYETVAIGQGNGGIVAFFSSEKDVYSIEGSYKTRISLKNNTVSWYNSGAPAYQCNYANYRYFYFVIY